jgi:hypothetical protein
LKEDVANQSEGQLTNTQPENTEVISIPAGTTIKWNGLPFQLVNDTDAYGREENKALAADGGM